jgi:hypothetical protein
VSKTVGRGAKETGTEGVIFVTGTVVRGVVVSSRVVVALVVVVGAIEVVLGVGAFVMLNVVVDVAVTEPEVVLEAVEIELVEAD